MKSSVTAASCRGDGHGSDQRAIWSEIRDTHRTHGTSSRTGDLADCHTAHRERIERMQKRIGYVEGAHGLVVAVGDHLACLDLFDRPRTLEKAWDRLLSGAGREYHYPSEEAPQASSLTLEDVPVHSCATMGV